MSKQLRPAASRIPPAMILCGGEGTRLRDVTELLPKPMVPVGPHPILWHIMKGYAAFGVNRFILCLGYKREVFIDYFLSYRARATDITVLLGKHAGVIYHAGHGEETWEVTLVDTGEKTLTGGRIARAARYLQPGDREFFLTYGDAVSDIDIADLLSFHRRARKCLTVTAIQPAGRFGELGIAPDGTVIAFREKPLAAGGYVNGGFMVANRTLPRRYLTPDELLSFEQAPMSAIQKDGEMAAYRHQGFWQCMDTPREHILLNSLWNSGQAPWTMRWT